MPNRISHRTDTGLLLWHHFNAGCPGLEPGWPSREAKRRGQNTELVWDGLIWVLVGGILGARIWHILTPPPSMVALGITTSWYPDPPIGYDLDLEPAGWASLGQSLVA